MSDTDGRDRRRVGDATLQRIEDLADGWKVPPSDEQAADTVPVPKSEVADDGEHPSAPPGRSKRPSVPPPPPGSSRSKRASAPPPPPRSKRESAAPPPPPRSKRESAAPPSPPRPKRPSSPPPPPPGRSTAEDEAITRPVEKSEPELKAALTIDSDRDIGDDDPTRFEPPGSAQKVAAGGQLRRPQVLPRKRGLLGDIGYVVRVLFKVTEARRELTQVNKQIAGERAARDQKLISIARQTIADPDVDIGLIDRARDELAQFEDSRSRRAGAAAAADAEIDTIERTRTSEAKDHLAQIEALEGELADITRRLEPMEKQAHEARKKAAVLHDTLEEIDRKIANAKASLVSVKGPKADPAGIEAELASLRAERESVASEEPVLAAELDDLDPRIAALTAARREAEKSIAEIRERESESVERTAVEIEAVRARKAVEDRAVAVVDRERDEALLRLGESLAVERPADVTGRLRPVDELDLSIATLERRALELSELVGGVDRAAVIRGALLILVAVAAVVGLTLYLLL